MENTELTAILKSDNKKQNLKDLKTALKSLKKRADPAKQLDELSTHDTIAMTRCMLVVSEYREAAIKLVLEYSSHEKFAQLFECLCSRRDKIEFKELNKLPDDPLYAPPKIESLTAAQRSSYTLVYLDSIVNCMLVESNEFRSYLSLPLALGFLLLYACFLNLSYHKKYE